MSKYYVGIDDGEHHDMYFTSDSLFETLCEFNEAKITEDCKHYEWVEWGIFNDDDIETADYYLFGEQQQ